MGLTDLKGELAGSLPYGKQRKLEIARALATQPSLLLLDEPAAGMNPSETDELKELICGIRDRFRHGEGDSEQRRRDFCVSGGERR